MTTVHHHTAQNPKIQYAGPEVSIARRKSKQSNFVLTISIDFRSKCLLYRLYIDSDVRSR